MNVSISLSRTSFDGTGVFFPLPRPRPPTFPLPLPAPTFPPLPRPATPLAPPLLATPLTILPRTPRAPPLLTILPPRGLDTEALLLLPTDADLEEKQIIKSVISLRVCIMSLRDYMQVRGHCSF